MENTNNNHTGNAVTAHNPNMRRESTGTHRINFAFCPEALAPCLADLKRQLELRQAMH